MLSDVKNEVTDLYGNKYINDNNNTTQEGFPISSWYGYVADGYFPSLKRRLIAIQFME